MELQPLREEAVLTVQAINTLYLFQFATGYVFRGERHPFWEMVYVLSGQVDIGADERVYALGAGDLIFHKPDEYHSIWASYAHSPDLLVVSFACDCPAMQFFENRCIRVAERHRALLDLLLAEARGAFRGSLSADTKEPAPGYAGGVYTLRLLLTALLMELLNERSAPVPARMTPAQKEARDMERQIDRIIGYMQAHIHGELRFGDLCQHAGMSGTSMKLLFRSCFSSSPIAYFERLRMIEAQKLLRQGRQSIAAVADALGFSSPAYFATRFKAITGQKPSEYLRELQSHAKPGLRK